MMLLSLGLLLITLVLIAVNFILNLLSLTVWTWEKLQMLYKYTATRGSIVQYIVCRLADAQKSIASMFKKLRTYAWQKAGDLHRGSTSVYLETHGELDPLDHKNYANAAHRKAMKEPIDIDKMRKAGM